MKLISISIKAILCCLLLLGCKESEFEGVITWSVTQTDNDPERAAEKERMMQSLRDQMGIAKPDKEEVTIKIKNGNLLVDMTGNAVTGNENVYLYLKDKDQLYMISHESKIYRDVTFPLNETGYIKISKTNETKKILDYTCVKTVVSSNNMDQVFWTTNEIKNFDLKGLTRQSLMGGGPLKETLFYEGIEGVPLRIEIVSSMSTRVMEVTEIKSEKFPETDFTIPADWREIVIPKN